MKRIGFLVALLIILGLLAAGAYTAARVLGSGAEQGGGLRGFGPSMVTMDRAPELPAGEPDLVGIFVRRQDNSLYLGTGNIKFHTIRENDGAQPTFEAGYDGPVIEVVVTHDTVIYQDVTDRDAPVKENGKIQQVVAAATLDSIAGDRLVQVWGERQGDRVLARLLVIFSPPT